MAATISLGMIVRNASATLGRCLDSVAPYVDEIVIGLGGESTDDTEEIARKYTDKIIPIEWHDDFSEARNIVLKATTGSYFLWLDADDELIGGEKLRELPEAHPMVDSFHMGYDYAQSENGACTCYLVRERLIKKSHGWKWVGRIHEVLDGPPDHVRMLVGHLLVKHHPQPKDDYLRNMRALYRELEESEPNPTPRVLMYLGSENANRGNFREALTHFQRYIALSDWDEEKYQAQHRVADIYRAMSEFDRARQADFKAIAIRPDWPDAYFGLAETALFQKNYAEVIEWTKVGASKDAPQTMLIVNPRDYDFHPYVVLANTYLQTGDYDLALQQYQHAMEIIPDPQIAVRLQALQTEVSGHQLVDAAMLLWTHLAQNDEWLKARYLFDYLPKLIEKTPPILEKSQFTRRVTRHVENPQIMVKNYVENPNWQPMSDEVLDGGWRRHPRLEFARKVSKGADVLLDLGCSDGFMSIPLAQEGIVRNVVGVDLDPRCVKIANDRAEKREVSAIYKADDLATFELGYKADIALLFEVIEHVVDPEALLAQAEKSANHVAITTPYLAFQSPAQNWDKDELKGHLRIFDSEDIERMLGGRGRILNLYREPAGPSGWIFADYRPGERTNGHVTILAPGTPEPWSPRTFEREGLGGSETAVIKLGEAFSRLGRQVSVYSRMSEEGYWEGVRYRDQNRYVPFIHSDVFIAWRAPELIDDPVNSPCKILWMHDTDAGDRLTPDRAAKFTNIVVLTEWHKKHVLERYPFIEPEKLVVIPNGIDTRLFATEPPVRENNRVIYSSSPDRGLDVILKEIWPRVLEQVPDAELHVFYGWNNFDTFLDRFPVLREMKQDIMEAMSRTHNVVQHGRVSQRQLIHEMRKSSVWLYPTHFTETYCITAIEAQLSGLYPITNNLAALAETVKSGFILDYEKSREDWQQAIQLYVEATVQALLAPEVPELRVQIMDKAPAYSWDQVAEMWESRWLASESDTPQLALVSSQ